MIGTSMTEGSPWKHILKFALPVMAGSLLQQLYNTVDTIIVGNILGESALSAVGTTGSITFLFLTVAMGFSAGNGIIISQYYGANDEKQMRKNASTGIILLLGLGAVSTVTGLLFSKLIFYNIVAVPGEILGLTLSYFRVYALGLIFQFGYNIFASVLRGVGDSKATLYFLLIASVLNIILDYLFIKVFGFGVAGAAAATDISQAVSFVAAYYYLIKKYKVFRFKLKEFTWETPCAAKTITIGFPIFLQLAVVSIGLTLIQRAVNGFGKVMTAASTVGQRMEMYINLPCQALQTTMATYTGQNIGSGKMERVRAGTRQAMIISFVVTLCISSLIWIFADNIIGLFALSEEATVYCRQYLNTIAFINLILAMYIPLFGVFQGANHPAVPTFVVTMALTVRVFVTYLFRYSKVFGYTIIWFNGVFGFGAAFLIAWTYYFSNRWQKNALIMDKANDKTGELP